MHIIRGEKDPLKWAQTTPSRSKANLACSSGRRGGYSIMHDAIGTSRGGWGRPTESTAACTPARRGCTISCDRGLCGLRNVTPRKLYCMPKKGNMDNHYYAYPTAAVRRNSPAPPRRAGRRAPKPPPRLAGEPLPSETTSARGSAGTSPFPPGSPAFRWRRRGFLPRGAPWRRTAPPALTFWAVPPRPPYQWRLVLTFVTIVRISASKE